MLGIQSVALEGICDRDIIFDGGLSDVLQDVTARLKIS